MAKLNIIESSIKASNPNNRILNQAHTDILKYIPMRAKPQDYSKYIKKTIVSELYKGKNPSSLLTYIPRINLIDLARNPEAYIKKKARIIERIVKWRTKQAAMRLADELINGKPSNSIKIEGDLKSINDARIKLVDANTPVIESGLQTFVGEKIRHYLQLEADGRKFVDAHAILKVNENKNILMTKVQGRDLTRKEYISGGDYMISITGKIVSPYQDVYPTEEVTKLLKILKHKGVIKCRSPFLDIFEVSTMIVLSYDFPQSAGFSNVQTYTINAVYEKSIEAIKYDDAQRKKILEAKAALDELIAQREGLLEANEETIKKYQPAGTSLKDYLNKLNPKQFLQQQSWI